MWSAALPAVVWVLSISSCICVAVICIARSHYGRSLVFSESSALGQPVRVRPVTWPVITWHLISLALGLLAYGIYMADGANYPIAAIEFYTNAGWISAALLVLLIAVSLLLMYIQARRATRSQIEEVLAGATMHH